MSNSGWLEPGGRRDMVRYGQAGVSARHDVPGSREPASSSELSQAQLAAETRARIEAEYYLARRFPRDLDVVRAKLLADCRRPKFAEKARFKRPQGRSFIEGPSIRFVEAALRAMGNLVQEARVVYDDQDKRKLLVTVRDTETNTSMSAEVVVDKTIERRDTRGRSPADVIGSRTNSNGDTVYLVRATEDELTIKQSSLVSKAIRTVGMRLIPSDLVEEAMDVVQETQEREDRTDPDNARKRIIDAFLSIGVQPDALKAYVGHDLSALSPVELQDLRSVYAAIHSGETTWREVMSSVVDEDVTSPAVDQRADSLRDRLSAKAQSRAHGRTNANQRSTQRTSDAEAPTAEADATRQASSAEDDANSDH